MLLDNVVGDNAGGKQRNHERVNNIGVDKPMRESHKENLDVT